MPAFYRLELKTIEIRWMNQWNWRRWIWLNLSEVVLNRVDNNINFAFWFLDIPYVYSAGTRVAEPRCQELHSTFSSNKETNFVIKWKPPRK